MENTEKLTESKTLSNVSNFEMQGQKSGGGGKAMECQVCKKGFNRVSTLKNHMYTHTTETPFKCKICNKGYKQQVHLNRHSKIHDKEAEEVLFWCQICDQGYRNATCLARHISRVHNKDKRFACQVCNKKFHAADILKQHEQSHIKGKSYQCEVCSKTFSKPKTLENHCKTHNGVKPFQCPVCSKRFSNPYTLKDHQRIHIGQKPFQCQLCKERFDRLDILKQHARETVFECQLCNTSSTQGCLSSFKNHVCPPLPSSPDIQHVQEDENREDIDIETEIQIDEIKYPPIEEFHLENGDDVSFFTSEKSGNSASDNESMENKLAVAHEIMSSMIDKLSPIQRRICNICMEDQSDLGIHFSKLISQLEKTFPLESKDRLENTVIEMATRTLVGSNDPILLIADMESRIKSEFGDDCISRFENAQVKLNCSARLILQKIKPEVGIVPETFQD